MSWMLPAAMALQTVGSLAGGQDPRNQYGQTQGERGNLHLVNTGQADLYRQMLAELGRGGGDSGYGANTKAGISQLQQMMAARGVSVNPGSGAYAGAAGNVIGQAAAADAAARRNYMTQLLGTPLQVAQVAGANYVPTSSSIGTEFDDQYNSLTDYRRGGGGSRWY